MSATRPGQVSGSALLAVLVVEDNIIVAMGLAMDLEDSGHTVVGPAARVSQALTLIETEAIDIALLDVDLNGEQSFPIAEVLANLGIPFAFLTAHASADIQKLFPGVPVIGKPYLDATVKGVLRQLVAEGSLRSL